MEIDLNKVCEHIQKMSEERGVTYLEALEQLKSELVNVND